MTVEEKARRYDESLKNAKDVYTYYCDDREQLRKIESIFPELRTSEDERIRKALISILKSDFEKDTTIYDISVSDIIAWLENLAPKPHGKSALSYHEEKVEPKFKIGQWIVWQDKCYKVNYNGCGYELVDQNGLSTSLEYGTIDENAHIWDITKDAKNGDVLANDHHILILKELDYNWGDEGTPSAVKAYCGIKPNCNFEIGKDNWCFCGTLHIHPATKEQCNLLFQKMKEESYKWDAESKQLIKLRRYGDKRKMVYPW